jgi:Uncharacterised nucleotidyltransferase
MHEELADRLKDNCIHSDAAKLSPEAAKTTCIIVFDPGIQSMSSAASTGLVAVASSPALSARSMSPEFDLVLACSSASRAPETEARIQALLSVPLDWSQFMEQSDQHGVLPLVQQRLESFRSLIPSTAWGQLKTRMTDHVRCALRLTHLLHNVSDALVQAGIGGLAYKGPVLAQRLYGDVAMRQFSDLDLFLPTADILEATKALKKIGLAAHSTFRQAEWREFVKTGYELTFDGFGNQNLLEIKWRVLPRFYAIDIAVEELFERAQSLQLSEKSVLTLCDDDLFLLLCVHAYKHAWSKLSWIADIARLIQCADLDWDWLMQRAFALGIQRIIGINLFLAQELLNSETPAPAVSLLTHDPTVRLLAAEIARNMGSNTELHSESLAYFWLMLKTREHQRKRIKFVVRLILTPTETEWSMIKLPAALFPLYRLVRLFRLIGRALRLQAS